MAAFERVLSGIPQMDQAFDNIRLGDNVVWQVSDLSEFRTFVEPYVEQAKQDGRNIIYIRFAAHEPILIEENGIKVYQVKLSHRFETFTIEIHRIIEKEGRDAFYVFDCLSELQVAWSTDLMMGNFFRVTCPFLFQLDTVAYFPILRGRHSFQAVAKIRETTQLFLDVYSDEKSLYVHPLKVWNRYSPTMFLPHAYIPAEGIFKPLTDGVSTSRFYAVLNRKDGYNAQHSQDSYDRFFDLAKLQYERSELSSDTFQIMCKTMMTRDEKMREMVYSAFTPEDLFHIRARMIGSGMIGGKACGMLLARKLVERELENAGAVMEPHDSFYIGSDVFYTYIVANGFWNMRIRQRSEEEYFSIAPKLQEALRTGNFPKDIEEQFIQMLEYYGQSPIIVRSSSILEDGFGNAFAGKYESVFCVNQGELEDRLKAFEDAVRTVYASTMDNSALEYRKQRGLADRDEQMALLVQRVSGSSYDGFFMPDAAGVGYSYSSYKVSSDMKPEEGMLRVVMGLGTRAVDRTNGDYPCIIGLSCAQEALKKKPEERQKYSQHNIDVLDTIEGKLSTKTLTNLGIEGKSRLVEHDYELERMFRERGQSRDIYLITCKGFIRNEKLIHTMKRILSILQEHYEYPVDIEFTVNFGEKEDFVINLLQCRPLQLGKNYNYKIKEELPKMQKENVLLHIKNASMGHSRMEEITHVVYIDPQAYYTFQYYSKPLVARAVGEVNRYYKEKGMHLLLLTPGRIGTSSPELGVPVVFADICNFMGICEISYSKAGYCPELSFGSHMFQDLVEADIYYGAIYENEKTCIWNPMLLDESRNCYSKIMAQISPQMQELAEIIHVYDCRDLGILFYHNEEKEETICGIPEK